MPRFATAEEACKDTHVQCLEDPVLIVLHLQDGNTFSQTLPPPNPIVQFDYLYVFPGLTLYIEADVAGDKLVNLHMVPANVHPEKTLVLTFQQGGMGGQYGMAFHIEQPFDRPLKYHAGIMMVETEDGHLKKTSTCPLAPKGGTYETWPDPIFQLVLGEFRFLDPKSNEVGLCTY